MSADRSLHVVAVGASAGGVEALGDLVGALPARFPAAVLVVLHISAARTSGLARILERRGRLPCTTALEGDRLAAGQVLVAPADRHLLLVGGRVALSAGPRENGHRPAIDPTFRAVAAGFGPRAVGVVLSGTRDDGTAGLARIVAGGGRALVQDPDEALFDAMPRSAAASVSAAAVLGVDALAARLAGMVRADDGDDHDGHEEVTVRETRTHHETEVHRDGTRYTCPDCGGVLWHERGAGVRYVCSVGHAYAPESLDEEQGRMVEDALWAAARMLGDRAAFLHDLAERSGAAESAGGRMLHDRSAEAKKRQDVLLELMEERG